jgi:hypothetical protein
MRIARPWPSRRQERELHHDGCTIIRLARGTGRKVAPKGDSTASGKRANQEGNKVTLRTLLTSTDWMPLMNSAKNASLHSLFIMEFEIGH